MYLSELIAETGYTENIEIRREKAFVSFSAISNELDEEKCIFIKNERWADIDYSKVSMVITTEKIAPLIPESVGVCVTDNPRGLFFALLDHYEEFRVKERKRTTIGNECSLSDTAKIAPFNVVIGDGTRIDDYVVIGPNVEIGSNARIAAGVKIGVQGYAVYQFQGKTRQSYCAGKVIIEDDVLIGSNTVIEQALYDYGETRIGEGSFIAPNVTIQHNSHIGQNVEICCGVNIAGNVRIDNNAVIYVGANLANRIRIGENAVVGMGGNVIHDIPDGEIHIGNPARVLLPNSRNAEEL